VVLSCVICSFGARLARWAHVLCRVQIARAGQGVQTGGGRGIAGAWRRDYAFFYLAIVSAS